MPDWMELVLTVVSCGVFVAFTRWLGGGTFLSFDGLFAPQARPTWPRRVQEADPPHFDVVHLDDLRPGTPIRLEGGAGSSDDATGAGVPTPEVIDLGSHPIGRG